LRTHTSDRRHASKRRSCAAHSKTSGDSTALRPSRSVVECPPSAVFCYGGRAAALAAAFHREPCRRLRSPARCRIASGLGRTHSKTCGDSAALGRFRVVAIRGGGQPPSGEPACSRGRQCQVRPTASRSLKRDCFPFAARYQSGRVSRRPAPAPNA
jgi:hypothetical protein